MDGASLVLVESDQRPIRIRLDSFESNLRALATHSPLVGRRCAELLDEFRAIRRDLGHGPATKTPPQPRSARRRRHGRTSLELGDPRHGTANGYTNHDCRCGPCTEANRIDNRERRGTRAAR
jgi:hypothetical protein